MRLVADGSLAATLPAHQPASWRVVLEPVSALPVESGALLGRAELLVEGEVLDTVGLRSAGDVSSPPPASPALTVGGAVQEALRAYARLEPVDRPA